MTNDTSADRAELAAECKRLAGEYGIAKSRNNEFDNGIGVERTCKDLFAAIDALARSTDAPSEPVELAEGAPWLCRAWGGVRLPGVAIAYTREQVSEFIVNQWLGSADHVDWDGAESLPRIMGEFDEHDWKSYGSGAELLEWEFEIGGVSIESVGEARLATPPAAATSTPCASGEGAALDEDFTMDKCRELAAYKYDGKRCYEIRALYAGRAPTDSQAGRDAVEARRDPLPLLDDDLRVILGRPNFMCARIAEDLRAVGFEIAHKSEHEQAAVLHYTLGFYLSHGAGWADACADDIKRRVDALAAAGRTPE